MIIIDRCLFSLTCPRTFVYWQLHVESGQKWRLEMTCDDVNLGEYGVHSSADFQEVLNHWNGSQLPKAPHHWRYAMTEDGLSAIT